jgi:hypothetical protein
VDSDQPHISIERSSFIELMKYMNPTAESIGADAIKKDLMSTFGKMQLELIHILQVQMLIIV